MSRIVVAASAMGTREADGDLKVDEKQKYGTAYIDRTVTNAYDLSGRLKTLAYPGAITMTYAYDDVGRAVTINDGANDRGDVGWSLGEWDGADGGRHKL